MLYELSNGNSGSILGEYNIPQPGKTLVELSPPPSSSPLQNWQRTGNVWERTPESLAADSVESSLSTKKTTLAQNVATLRQWKTDSDSAVAAWDGQTQAQKNATLKVVIGRFGTICDRLADFIEVQRL